MESILSRILSLGSLVAPVAALAKDQRVWVIVALFGVFIVSIERAEGYLYGPWPHQRRGDDRFNAAALGSRSAWTAVAMLLLPGLLLAVVIAVVRFWNSLPISTSWLLGDHRILVGLALVLVAWLIFAAASTNVLRFGHYLQRVGLAAPLALFGALALADVLLLLSLIELAGPSSPVR